MIEIYGAKRTVSFWKKLNPIWWFGNEDDGWFGDDKWRNGRNKTLLLALIWFFRNPLHNFTFYVIGVADKPRTFEYEKVWGKSDGFNLTFVKPLAGLFKGLRLPMLSYVGKKRGWYVGWRPYGSFGISLNFAGSYIAKRNSENK